MARNFLEIADLLCQAGKAQKSRQFDKAQSHLTSALALSPTHNTTLHAAALLADQQGHHERALDLFARAAGSDHPQAAPAEYHASHAAALGRAGQHGEALAAADRALGLKADL